MARTLCNLLPFFLLSMFLPRIASFQDEKKEGMPASFRPSVGIVVGIFAVMFSMTFLLLIYAKFCHAVSPANFLTAPSEGLLSPLPAHGGAVTAARRSGVEKAVIESLPYFQFSSLRGARAGLECAVCLSRFEDAETLRLLPKCKHAFHMDCVDRWLDDHSSCPLCRCKVDAGDAVGFQSLSSRFPSGRFASGELELFVERHPHEPGYSSRSRFSVSSNLRRSGQIPDPCPGSPSQTGPPTAAAAADDRFQFLHKFKHRIIVSDVVFKSRWSDVSSADLMSLTSDMLSVISNVRFSPAANDNDTKILVDDGEIAKIKGDIDKKRVLESKVSQMSSAGPVYIPDMDEDHLSRMMLSPVDRSVSEITNLPRFWTGRYASGGAKEETVSRIWLPIARRTVQWFAGGRHVDDDRRREEV